ncbi:MAG TPA: signal peptidase I [Segeticoccus sp.]|uniref:signal peptidase I n=1 Tax=Segeticoccus sp. TaxID=2706531 RepID=UPI002D7F2FA5|nr:signal peptidase I [Segeticoccus sp.]HET8601551.1 signal peptidase I [Segeticoccus sp.]
MSRASRRGGRCRHLWPIAVVLAVAVVVAVGLFVVQPFAIPSASMTPALRPGDRVLVLKWHAADVHRGEVIVFHEPSGWGPDAGSTDYVKRVIGLPGERVACCSHGRVTVDGRPLKEPYLHPGDAPSTVRFDVRVPPGHVWVMGDHRSDSDDSRSHLGDPGGGMVPLDDVIGRVAYRYWPPDRLGPAPRHQPEAVAR